MFAMKEIGEQIPFRYARLSNPTRKVLEDTVAALEHGAAGFAFGSGMAGIDCVFRTFLRPATPSSPSATSTAAAMIC